jgi:hypothetical protein
MLSKKEAIKLAVLELEEGGLTDQQELLMRYILKGFYEEEPEEEQPKYTLTEVDKIILTSFIECDVDAYIRILFNSTELWSYGRLIIKFNSNTLRVADVGCSIGIGELRKCL